MIPNADTTTADPTHARTIYLTGLLLDHLLPFPRPLQQLQSALEEPSTDLQKACAALEADPLICANFLHIAGMAEPTEPNATLDQWIVLLGKQRAWSVAAAAFVLQQIDGEYARPALKRLAALARQRGIAALEMALLAEDEAPEQAYAFGVLSVVGLLPLIDIADLPAENAPWIGLAPESITRQRELFGTDCQELGHWISLLWRLPVGMQDEPAPEYSPMPPRPSDYRLLVMPQRTM
jgi:HD-like signal output (HDOD) protein